LSDQLFRSAASVAANYRAAIRARSRREFSAKLGIVAEEAEESAFWVEFGIRTGLLQHEPAARLLTEARDLLAIFIASQKTVNANMPPLTK
jgi:four helix bundle protein